MSGNDVTILQNFLKGEGSFNTTATGYFGPVTEAALANWQLKAGIIASIVDGGIYGPKTKQYVAKKYCGAVTTQQQTITNQCAPAPTKPTLSCVGTWQKTYGTNACHVGWTCVPAQTAAAANKPPKISSITGPSKLKPDESGTWNIVASDPEGEQLTFTIIWGDEGGSTAQLLELAGLGTNATTKTSFSHAYQSGGYFTIVVFAHDTADNSSKATFSVTVEAPVPVYSQAGYYAQAGYYSEAAYGQTTTAQSHAFTGPTGGTASCVQGNSFWQGHGNTYPHEATVCSVSNGCWFAQRCCNGKWFGGGNIIGAGSSCSYWVGSYLDQSYRNEQAATCTFENTPVGSYCGGKCHVTAGINVHYWGDQCVFAQ